MSYYSDAAAVMYKKDYEEIRNNIFYADDIDEFDRSHFEDAIVTYKDDIVIIKWENVNHFGRGSTSMKMFLDFVNTVPHNFLRIGEGVDDQSDIESDITEFEDIDEFWKFNILGYRISIVID